MINLDNHSLRTYNMNTTQYYLYRDMHINQTLEFVLNKKNQYRLLCSVALTLNMCNPRSHTVAWNIT